MGKINRMFLCAITCFLCAGCSTNVAMSDQFWEEKPTVVVAAIEAPEPKLHGEGGQSLLEMAVHAVMNRKINAHLETVNTDWYVKLAHDFTDNLKKKGFEVTEHKQPFQNSLLSEYDRYESLAEASNAKAVLLLQLKSVGALQYYYDGMAIGEPKSYCSLTGELVDIETGKTLWRYTSTFEERISGKWSQPPDYPNLTKSLEFTTAKTSHDLMDNFFLSADISIAD